MTIKLVSSVILAGAFATAAAAQTSTGPRWAAYAGCWEPVWVEGQTASTDAKVCIVPSADGGADLFSIVNNKVGEKTRIESDGAHHAVSRQGCAGWESSAWSADGRRLFFNSEQQCTGGVQRTGSGIYAIGSNGRWTNVVDVNAGGAQSVRVLRYAPMRIDSTVPAEITAALAGQEMANATARTAAQGSPMISNVIEASTRIKPAVVQAWIATSEAQFNLNAQWLTILADDSVPAETIDVMIAVSNPGVFAVAPKDGGTYGSSGAAQPVRATVEQDCYRPIMDPWGYNDYYCDSYRRYGYYRSPYAYGYDPYYRYGFYGQYNYGYGYGSGYGTSPVIVIVKGSANDPQTAHGRMTRNGYSNSGASTSGSTASTNDAPAPVKPPSGSGSSTSSGSGSSGSGSSSSGSSGGSSTGRTAVRKPPAR